MTQEVIRLIEFCVARISSSVPSCSNTVGYVSIKNKEVLFLELFERSFLPDNGYTKAKDEDRAVFIAADFLVFALFGTTEGGYRADS